MIARIAGSDSDLPTLGPAASIVTIFSAFNTVIVARAGGGSAAITAKPEVPTVYLRDAWRSAAAAALLAIVGTAPAFRQSARASDNDRACRGARRGEAPR